MESKYEHAGEGAGGFMSDADRDAMCAPVYTPAPEQNPSGILPTGYKVLVKSELGVMEQKYAAIGLEISDDGKERDQAAAIIGKLIAVSPLAFTYHDDWAGFEKPQPGQRVVYGKYSGTTITGQDGEEYKILNDQDLIAVLAF